MATYIRSIIVVIGIVLKCETEADYCGCKTMRPCYKKMLDDLLGVEEEACVENVAISAATVTVFLKALKTYCDKFIEVYENETTLEGRTLYEVVISRTVPVEIAKLKNGTETRPIMFLEAGQDAGSETVGLALYVIEQLLACFENREMIRDMIWVILPSTNPDGQEYGRNSEQWWQKNYRPMTDIEAYGVDVSKNFDDSFGNCPHVDNKFSQHYQGSSANSELETKFITNCMKKYSSYIKSYVSLRRNGHAILYPLASKNVTLETVETAKIKAGEISKKVNQRAGALQWFVNQSIFSMNGKANCGHSVDFAFNKLNIAYSFEMRVFPVTDIRIMSKFQALPKGYEVSLRMGYFSGIRELYNILVDENSTQKLLKKVK